MQFYAVPYDAMQYNGKHKHLIFGPFLGQKRALAGPLELAQQHEQHKNVVFLVSGHNGNEEIGGCAQKIDFRPKNSIFGPKKGRDGKTCRYRRYICAIFSLAVLSFWLYTRKLAKRHCDI